MLDSRKSFTRNLVASALFVATSVLVSHPSASQTPHLRNELNGIRLRNPGSGGIYWVDQRHSFDRSLILENSGINNKYIAQSVCPYGGTISGSGNCQLMPLKLKRGVRYWLDLNPQHPGVYYKQVNGDCSYGGGDFSGDGNNGNCQFMDLRGKLQGGVKYWIDLNSQYPGIYYKQVGIY